MAFFQCKAPIAGAGQMARTGLLLVCLLAGPSATAQWRILYKVEDIMTSPDSAAMADTTHRITLIEPRGSLSKYLIVRYVNARRDLVDRQTIWGYTNGQDTWRCYGEDDFRVKTFDGNGVEYNLRLTNGMVTLQTFYSRTLNSPIQRTWERDGK